MSESSGNGYLGLGAGFFIPTEMRPKRLQHLSLAVSLALHSSYLLYLQIPLWRAGPPPPAIQVRVTKLLPFVAERPARPAPAPEQPKLAQPVEPTGVPQILAEEKVPHSIESPDESKADMTRAVLRYDDPRRELLAILRRYRGYIGFGRRDELDAYVRRMFTAADGKDATRPGDIVSLEEFCSIRINGSGYPVVEELRRRHGLEDQIAYALFSSAFSDEVKHTLRKAALDRFGGGKIASATLILSASVENGLVAGEMLLAEKSGNGGR